MSDNGSVGEEKVEVIARFEGEEDNNESTDGTSKYIYCLILKLRFFDLYNKNNLIFSQKNRVTWH